MSGQSLITNQSKFLKEVFENILPSANNLFFLVGYFFFSGFQALYKNLGDKHLRILVGMDIELDIQNTIKEFSLLEKVENSRGAVRDSFYRSLVNLCNDTDFFDHPEKEEAFMLYIEKIKNGSLEVKKTMEPNHAKLYLFEHLPTHTQRGEFPQSFTSLSSFLSHHQIREDMVKIAIPKQLQYCWDYAKIIERCWIIILSHIMHRILR